MGMMEELNRIDWGDLVVASGKANQVPKALIGLLSPDESIRNRAYAQLDNEVVCQSDLYNSSYFVIPFLIRLLADKVEYGRDRMYDLLYEIANGYAPSDVKCRTNEGEEMTLKEACDRELKKGLSTFRNDALDHDNQISQKALELIELLADSP